MPYLVGYVVADVVLVRVLMSALAGCRHVAVHALVGSGPQAASRVAKTVAESWAPGEMQPVPMRPWPRYAPRIAARRNDRCDGGSSSRGSGARRRGRWRRGR